MNPAQVNARIAELVEAGRYWADPATMAEAVKLWGGKCNEHGVFTDHDRIEIARTPHAHATVLVAESGNGLFGYGLEYGCQMGGGGGFPSVWREAFGSREEAKAAAVAVFFEQPGRGGDKRQAELVRKVKANGCRRTLFDQGAGIKNFPSGRRSPSTPGRAAPDPEVVPSGRHPHRQLPTHPRVRRGVRFRVRPKA